MTVVLCWMVVARMALSWMLLWHGGYMMGGNTTNLSAMDGVVVVSGCGRDGHVAVFLIVFLWYVMSGNVTGG